MSRLGPLVCLAATMLSWPAASRQASFPAAEQTPAEFQKLLERYGRGEAQRAVAAALAWDARRLRVVADSLPSKTTASMLLEIAVARDYPEPFRQDAVVARKMMAAIWSRGGDPMFCRAWFLASAAVHLAHLDTGGAAADLDVVEARAGRDADTLTSRGACLEVISAPPALPPDLPLLAKRSGLRSGLNAPWTSAKPDPVPLRAAAGFYRSALRLDPGWRVARLRLGRVLHLLKQDRDALPELKMVVDDPGDPRVSSLASLFTGQVHEAAGEAEAAASAYRASVTRYPQGQSPYLALARLLESTGRIDAARTETLRLFAPPASAAIAPDPWWLYVLGQIPSYEERFVRLRHLCASGGGAGAEPSSEPRR